MATASKYEVLADAVLRGVGGESNVASVTHCATRLRFTLKDRDKADKAAVEATRGVITVVESGGQFQVVIGNTVNNVYEALVAKHDIKAGDAVQGGLLAKAIDLITSIFTPFLWVLAGTGLLKALLAVWVKLQPEAAANSTYAILYVAGDALFQFLPMLLAVTAAKKFKANVYTSLAIAGALIYSATIAVIPNADGVSVTLQGFAGGDQLTFIGIPVIMVSYLSAVIPTILAVYAQAKLEHLLTRVLPEAIRNFVTPMLVVAIIVPLTFLVIGPVSDWVGTGLSNGVNWLWGLSPVIGGALMGAFWQVFVIFGVHWSFVPAMIQDLSTQGYSLLTGPLFAAVLAQGAAAAAVFVKTRNKELKEVAGPAAISGILAGITEPAIYGVTLRLKRPFVYGVIGGAIGGAIAAAGGSAAEGFVLPGLITLTSTINIGSFAMQLLGTGLAVVIAFVLTMVLGFKDLPSTAEAVAEPEDAGEVASEAVAVTAPAIGTVVPLDAVPDKVFSSGAMGAGLAVVPAVGEAFAPVSGELVTVMPHAFGIRTDTGLEVLVHVGLDTVELKGRHFTAAVAQGARVRAGDLLTQFDLAAIEAAGYNPITVMIVTNNGPYSAVVPVATGDIAKGEVALDLVG
ncbi:beta-glucoside-specific PTS transporter subunit IIABC [Actinotalea sp. M2MS4P-6]|uniref:beta-glucoside-specific PTS transporter subunit IIABC n=1 Tax=Actinotalea sp. M2MS4P-6 TaxID=2983762 RepID=UPI0021E47A6A|nr:beta-glucoside-specific PTS transporter subunit IIABC [Actinotalea sp. M2MS4P-6]MCV2395738.1 beta-glucoside-specific PTS transporter subunit IIABC [Actinotalea sp. M2MS4P-6]